MEEGKKRMSSSEVEERLQDFLKLLQDVCRAGVALDNMKETRFAGGQSNASSSTAAARDDHTRLRKKEDEEEKMAVVYIVLVLVFFSTSLIILLVRHVRREKETRRLENFYRDYLLTTHRSPRRVVYFDKRGRPLQKGLRTSPSRSQGQQSPSTSSESDIQTSSHPSVSTAVASPSESSGVVDNGFPEDAKSSSALMTPVAPVDGAVSEAGLTTTPVQFGNVAVSTVIREGTKRECDTALLNTALTPTLPPAEKCIEFDNTSIEAAEVHDNTCELRGKVLSVTTPAPEDTATQCNTTHNTSPAKLTGKPTSV